MSFPSSGPRSAAIHARISKDDGQDYAGVKRQVEREMKRVQADPFLVLMQEPGSPIDPRKPESGHWPDGVFVDNDISAGGRTKTKHRPEYERLMKLARAGAVQTIVAPEQSRLWRNRREGNNALEDLRELGVRLLVSGQEIDLNNNMALMFASMQLMMDADEWEKTSKRWRTVLKHNAERGAYHGPRPFGYQLAHFNPDGTTHPAPPSAKGQRIPCADCAGLPFGVTTGQVRTMVPDPVEAPALLDAFYLVSRGIKVHQVRRYLDGFEITGPDGEAMSRPAVPTVGGKRWADVGEQSLLLVLKSKRYIGQLREHDGNWPPLVTQELFDAVQVQLAKRVKTEGTGGGPPRHLLTGFARCGTCGGKMRIHPVRGRRKYACVKYPGNGEAAMDAELAEREVQRVLYDWCADNGLLEKSRVHRGDTNLQELYDQRESLKGQLNDLEDEKDDGKIAADERYYRRHQRKLKQIAEVDAEISAVEGEADEAAVTALTGAAFRAWWPTATLENKRAYLAKFVDRVVIHPAGPGNPPDPRLVQVFPGAWDRNDAAQPVAVDPASFSSKGKILAYLKGHPGKWFTRAEIAEATGVTMNAVHKNLKLLGEAGEIGSDWRSRGGQRAACVYSAGGSATWSLRDRTQYDRDSERPRSKVMRVLEAAPGSWFTLKEISEQAGLTGRYRTVNHVLRELHDGGFINCRKVSGGRGSGKGSGHNVYSVRGR